MPDPDNTPTTVGPYGTHALRYHAAGWSPLPLPAGKKKHPPAGWTGRDGKTPSGADVHAWTEDHAGGNIALRLPPDVIGIDVDDYDAKPGGLVLAQLEQAHGTLPPTWRSTSRDDCISTKRGPNGEPSDADLFLTGADEWRRSEDRPPDGAVPFVVLSGERTGAPTQAELLAALADSARRGEGQPDL